MADLSDITLRISAEYGDVNKAVNATNSLERKVRTLAKAFVGGQIPQNQFEKGLRDIGRTLSKYSSSYQKAHYDVRQLGQEYVKAEKSQRKFLQSQMAATKQSNRMGVVTQQAGYQVSDFIVQIQSGTNAFVAFGQQASQLVGVLPLVAGRLGLTTKAAIGLSATLGIVIPIITMFGATWLNTRNSSEKAIEGIEEKINGLGAALDRVAGKKLTDFSEAMLSEVDKVTTGFETLLDVMKAVEAQNIKTMLNSIIDPFKDALIRFESLQQTLARTSGGEVSPEKELEIFKPLGVKNAEDALYVAQQLAKLQGESREELGKQLKIATENIRQRGLLTVGVGKTIDALIRELGIEEQHIDVLKVRITKLKEEDKIREALIASNLANATRANAKRLKDEQDAAEKAENTRKALIASSLANATRANAKRLEDEQRDEQNAATVRQALEMRFREIKAQEDKALADQTHAHMLALQKAYYDDAKTKAAEVASASYLANYKAVMAYQAYGESREAGAKTTPPKAPKGKTPAESMASIIEGMEKQANLQRQIVGLSDQEADYLQILYNLKEKNKTASGKMTEAELIRSAERIAAINAETAAMEAQMQKIQDVADSFETHFGDALMGIVTDFDFLNDSIEDFGYNAEQVFKNMASEIIKELYRIFVVKKITGFISGAVGDVGSLYQGSTGFMQFSGGGYTGSGPRSGGLDGKGGFLAMLHPKETVIDHTKGQSDAVVINNHFNFAANGDDSVKRIIVQSMPQITEAAKSGVLDARKRGGSFRKVFS